MRSVAADLVLIGGGHAHMHVIRMLAEHRQRWAHGIRVTLIAKEIHSPYFGMLPGFYAGHYSWEEVHVDLIKLCRYAGVCFIHAEATKITYNNNGSSEGKRSVGLIYCNDDRPPLRYDCLSIDIGSVPHVEESSAATVQHISSSSFGHSYQKLLARPKHSNLGCTIGVVGGGAGGVELALSIHHRLLSEVVAEDEKEKNIQIVLLTRGETILPTFDRGVRSVFERILKERNIQVLCDACVEKVESVADNSVVHSPRSRHRRASRKRLILSSASKKFHPEPLEVDECIWCATVGVASWLADNTPFVTTENGFVRVKDTYECIRHSGVFAAGNCSSMDQHPCPEGTYNSYGRLSSVLDEGVGLSF